MVHGKGPLGLESDCGIILYLKRSVNCGNIVWGIGWRVFVVCLGRLNIFCGCLDLQILTTKRGNCHLTVPCYVGGSRRVLEKELTVFEEL